MDKVDAEESVPICEVVLLELLAIAPTRGRPGSDLRTAVGDFLADAAALLQSDDYGPPLDDIFNKASLVGVTYPQFEDVRRTAVNYTPVPKTLGATLVLNSLIEFTLVAQGLVIANMTFVSRSDVETIRLMVNDAFSAMEELAADDMDQAGYQALVSMHAAISFHLTETARPLPLMLDYEFHQVLPTSVIAYKLYTDAARCDEVRAENKIVHPAFSPMHGRGLSS
jgi:hypothetical protein